MNNKSFVSRPNWLQRTGSRLAPVAAIALAVALTMPASAAESRAIKCASRHPIPKLPSA